MILSFPPRYFEIKLCVYIIQAYFEDNPRDLQLLRHDKDLHPAKIHPHLKHVPDYLGKI